MANDPNAAIADRLAALPRGARVFLAGCGGEPSLFAEALQGAPDAARDLVFTGVLIPGINRIDPSALAPGARFEGFFLTPDLREGFAAGRVSFRPMHYSAIYRHYCEDAGCALAITKVAPPGPDGRMSLGITADFLPAMVTAGVPIIAEIDPSMPDLPGAASISPDDCALILEGPARPVHYDAGMVAPESVLARIGEAVAGLVPDGATIQLGIGKVAAGVLGALAGHRRLSLHGGIITANLLPLVEAGVLAGPITTGTALGEDAFYRALPDLDRLVVAPVGYTHAAATLARLRQLHSINAVLTVDLFGQANGEMIDGRQISGHGGMVDFVRGARLSLGGRAILALPSTAGSSRTSRIVPALPAGTVASLARADADTFVTEHGVASVRDLDIDERAAAIIAIADPPHRESLAAAWAEMRQRM